MTILNKQDKKWWKWWESTAKLEIYIMSKHITIKKWDKNSNQQVKISSMKEKRNFKQVDIHHDKNWDENSN